MTLSSRPLASSRQNPCPVCGNTEGACRRLADDTVFCHSFVDAAFGEKVNGYICIKQADGHTATFKPDNSSDWTEQQRQQWEAKKALRDQLARDEEKQRRERALSPQRRHELYSQIFEQLSIDPVTLADLERRGFTESEIKACGFKSVVAGQSLLSKIDNKLPGVGIKGRSLANKYDGYLCPIYDVDGNVVACQMRLHNPVDGNRYRWLSTPNTATLQLYPEGENPLSVLRPIGQPKGIGLVEGVGAKAFLASRRLNLLVIGAPGGLWASSPKLLKRYLEQLHSEVRGEKIVTLFPDAGDVGNKGVVQRWNKVVKLLEQWGWTVQFAWWGQYSKDDDDIDELKDYSRIQYISPHDFYAVADKSKSQATNTQTEGADRVWQQWLDSRKFTPDITLDLEKFKFPTIPDSNVIVAVRSGMGTGKTEALLEMIKASNRGIHLIGYRNNLLFQTIDRGGLINLTIYHLREDDGHTVIKDDYSHQAFCLDSIARVDGYFKGRDICLDETCSVLLHACNGGTLGDNQAKVIKIFTQALQDANRIFLLDGNLADIWVDFISKLAQNKRVIKIENKRKIPSHPITFIDGIDFEGDIKKRDKSALLKALCADDVIPWISSDSKELTKVVDRLLKESGRTGFVLNAETAGEPWAKEFLADPNKFISEKKPQYFIVSPVAESGVSVTINDYFTVKFSILLGVQGTNSQHQQMFRLRPSLPHYVFCPTKSMAKDRANPNTYSERVYKEIINDRVLTSSLLCSQDSGSARATEIIAEAIKRQNDDWFEFSVKLGCLYNHEMDNLRKCLIHSLEEAGHHVEVLQWGLDEEFKEKEKAAKEAVRRELSHELFQVIPYNSIEEAKEIAKSSPGKDTQRRIEKTYLVCRLPGIENNAVWGADFIYEFYVKDREFIRKQERFYLLNNFEISQKRHEMDWFYRATEEDFFMGSVKKISHLTIWALKELNILQFLQGEYHKDSPEVLELMEKIKQSKDIRTALGIQSLKETVHGKERIETVSNLLAMIGIKFKRVDRRLVDGIMRRIYSVDVEAMQTPERLACLEAIDRKFSQWMLEKGQVAINWGDEQPEQQEEVPAEWLQPEVISELAEHLTLCDDAETLELRAAGIPKPVFKKAAGLLPQGHFKQWVLDWINYWEWEAEDARV